MVGGIDKVVAGAGEHAEQARELAVLLTGVGDAAGEIHNGTRDTSQALGELAALADALGASVQRFRLPVTTVNAAEQSSDSAPPGVAGAGTT